MANVRVMQNRIKEDARRRVTVRPAPLPEKPVTTTIPSFRHVAITDLYRHHLDISRRVCGGDPGVAPGNARARPDRGVGGLRHPHADFSRNPYEDSENFAPVHALHPLAEVHGTEACGALVGLLAIHPQAVEFWLGDTEPYQPQIARIIAADLLACFAWLKSVAAGLKTKWTNRTIRLFWPSMNTKLTAPLPTFPSVSTMPVVTATQLKTATADVFDLLASEKAIAIHRHDKPRGVLLSLEQYESLAEHQPTWLKEIEADCQAMFEAMQSPEQKEAALFLMRATPEELGAAAVRGARAKIASGEIRL